MPTYEYKCRRCGHQFEVVKKITEKPGSRCPKCGARAERLVSAGAGLVFKGSGFYVTDYKRPGEKAETGEQPKEQPKKKKKDQADTSSPKKDD
jgi:putative FmdB family regulatory protein